MGTQPQGQGHETTYAQVIAHELGIPMEDIVVQHSDTQGTPFGYGSYGSRTVVGRDDRRDQGGRQDPGEGPPLRRPHARGVAGRHRDRRRQLLRQGLARTRRRRSRRSPSRSTSRSTRRRAWSRTSTRRPTTTRRTAPGRSGPTSRSSRSTRRPASVELVPLRRGRRRRQEDQPDDRRRPAPRRHRPGRRPGALGAARSTSDDGQLLSGSMLDYALPRASCFPSIELDETVTPSPVNPIGVKGVGEAGCHREHRGGGQRRHATRSARSASDISTCRTRRRPCGGRSSRAKGGQA